MNFENIIIVLVEPQGALNIGSVCRSMMNFGFSKLRLVNPHANHLSLQSKKMALKASPILEKAKIFDTLLDAINDCSLVIGTTTRHGKYRNNYLLPDQAASLTISQSPESLTALVFGREDFGLSSKDLELCNKFVTIPTDKKFESMNLAQAVTICLYELGKNPEKINNNNFKKLSNIKETENMFSHMKKTLSSIDFLDPQNPDHIIKTFRNIFNESGLDERDVKVLHGLWSRIDWVKKEMDKYKK